MLGRDADHLARSNPCDTCQGRRNQGTKVFEGGTRRNEDDDAKASPTQVLLKLEVLIGSHEDVEAAVRRALK